MRKIIILCLLAFLVTASAQRVQLPFEWQSSQAKTDRIRLVNPSQAAFVAACEKIVRGRLKKQGFSVLDVMFQRSSQFGAIPQKATFSQGRIEWLWSSWASLLYNKRWLQVFFSCQYNSDNGIFVGLGRGNYSALIPPERR
jgi:hypothetical protein